jgi:hypothetical protein
MALSWTMCRTYRRPMQLSTAIDRVLGRAHLAIVDGGVPCPVRGSRVDIESCPPCPYGKRIELDQSANGLVVCRARTLWDGATTRTPPT